MKYFLYFIVLFFWFSISLWANDEVQVSVSSNQINIWESLILDIVFDPWDSIWEIELSIPGIEDFSVFSQSQQQRIQSINWEAQTQLQYSLQVRPQQEWSYSLWPVQINFWDVTVTDNEILSIQVWNGWIAVQENTDIETSAKPELQPLRNFEFSSLFILMILVLFFIVFFRLLKKYLDTKKQGSKESSKKHIPSPREKLREYFENLEKQSLKFEKQEFYKQLNIGIREIFIYENPHISRSKTLSELRHTKELTQHTLFSVFESTYFKEFSQDESDNTQRQEYIMKIIHYLEQ